MPLKLKPITAQAYAVVRAYIEAGTAAAVANDMAIAGGCTDHCMPRTVPSLTRMTDVLYTYIPMSAIPLEPGEEDADREGYGTFKRGREALLAALDEATPPGVHEELALTDEQKAEADAGGLEWWALALAATGVLRWLGRKSFRGAIIARIAAVLLGTLVAAKAIEVVTEEGAKLAAKGAKALAKGAGTVLWFALGTGALAVVTFAAVKANKKG